MLLCLGSLEIPRTADAKTNITLDESNTLSGLSATLLHEEIAQFVYATYD